MNSENGRLLQHKRKQKLRMKATALSFPGYLVAFALWFYAGYQGMWPVPRGVMIFLVLAGPLCALGYLWMIRMDWNLRFHDPSMTQLQILTAYTVNLPALYYMSHQARGVLLFLYMIPFIFTVLRLSYKQCFGSAVYALATYLLVLLLINENRPDQVDWHVEGMRIVVFGVCMGWFAFFAGYTSSIRRRLREKNRENQELLAKLEDLAEHDDLTKLFNRRKFMDTAERERERHIRGRKPFILALIDLDHFKKVNDRHGHQAGDQVLRRFAELTLEELRSYDIAGRYGGEEFIVLMGETEMEGAGNTLNRLLQRFQAETFLGSGSRPFHVGFSAGLARFNGNQDMEELIRIADERLYDAKQAGRGQIHPLLTEADRATA